MLPIPSSASVFRHVDTHQLRFHNRLDVHLPQLQPENRYAEHVQSAGVGGVCLPSLPSEAGSEGSAFDAVCCVDDVTLWAGSPRTHLRSDSRRIYGRLLCDVYY